MLEILITILVIVVIGAVAVWLINYIGLPAPFNKIAVVLVVLIVLVAIIYKLGWIH